MRYPQIGDVWQNKKHGTYYTVLGVVYHHRSGDPMVVYRNSEGDAYTRELEGVDDCWYERFTFIEAPTYGGRAKATSEGGE